MAGDDHDKMKVSAMNVIEVKYDDMLEDQHQTLEAYIKDYPTNCKRRLASCFGKTSRTTKIHMLTLSSKVQDNVSA